MTEQTGDIIPFSQANRIYCLPNGSSWNNSYVYFELYCTVVGRGWISRIGDDVDRYVQSKSEKLGVRR